MIKTLKALWRALHSMFFDLSIDIAGYIAYTCLLALFPFLILLVLAAGYVGTTEAAQVTIQQFYTVLPAEIVTAISPIINEVTNKPPSSVFTVVILIILWISSSSIEAIREGLNHAYDIKETRSIFYRRPQAILFVILASITFLLASFVLIILPIAADIWHYLEKYLDKVPILGEQLVHSNVSIIGLFGSYFAILISMAAMYKWLPQHKIKFSSCLPGAFISSSLWILMAAVFSLYLRSFARYDILYGSLGGIIVTLIFFHITAILILYGAHFNRALAKD